VLHYNFPNRTKVACDRTSAVSMEYYCCWTHGYAADACTEVYTPPLTSMVAIARNPYAWLKAMHEEPYEHVSLGYRTFSQFLRDEFKYTPGQYQGSASADTKSSAVALWVAKVDSYLNLTVPHVILSHLDLFDEAALTRKLQPLTDLGGYFPDGANRTVQLEPLLEAATNDKFSGEFTASSFAAAKAYELNQEWLAAYNDADLAFVNGIVGPERFARLGFTMVNTTSEARAIRSGRLITREYEAHEEKHLLTLLEHPRWLTL
jgi:hypothetical protein